MANEIDELMDLDPLSLSSQDIDKIIAYHRNRRADLEAGHKPKREIGPKIKLDLERLGLKKAPVADPIKRRV